MLRTTDGILKFTLSTGILSCRRDRLRHISIQSSSSFCFFLAAFVYFSFLAHFAITSLVVFAELIILLCYEVFVLKFR